MASSVAAPTPAAVGPVKGKYTHVVALGLVLMAAGIALWLVGALVAGQSYGEDGRVYLGIIAAGLVGSALVWRLGTVGKALGLVLVVAIMSQVFYVPFSLLFPTAFVEFSGAVMFMVGMVAVLGYGIAGIVRREQAAVSATPGEIRVMRIMIAIVGVAMVVSAVLNLTTRTSVEATAAAGATPVAFADFEFSPATIEATAGETNRLLVSNADVFAHNFVIEALGLDAGVFSPGSEKLVEINAPAGHYEVLCTLHPDMAGSLNVK